MSNGITRRGLLMGACSIAAHPVMSTMTLASVPSEARLVVIVLRGGMDGLDVVRPLGDPDFARYRASLSGDSLDLTGQFAMHPALGALQPMWQRQELAFAHAVSTPYRDARSHFDGQDLLEAGTGTLGTTRDGWLNRLVAEIPGAVVDAALGVGDDELQLLQGSAPVTRWTPNVDVELTPQAENLLRHIYAPDPLFAAAADQGMMLARAFDQSGRPTLSDGSKGNAVAGFAAQQLVGPARIAAFSVTGWDTHQNQIRTLPRALSKLQQMFLTLYEGLGPVWEKTLVLAMTEFGRTVAENGTGGTDHGTGGAMIMAGGALRGGQVFGDWPGLDEASLYDRRDLMPTDDVRRYAGWAMHDLFGVERNAIESRIFPGLDLGQNLRITR